MITRYKNKWWPTYGNTQYFETKKAGVEYHGFMIYERPDEETGIPIFDIVKDGVCVSQMAGMNGAMRGIDEMRIDAILGPEMNMM